MIANRSAWGAILTMAGLVGCNGTATPLSPNSSPFDPPLTNGNYALTSASCAAEPLRTRGTIYYVCDCGKNAHPRCVPGNDGTPAQPNPGTDPSRPLRSYSKAMELFGSIKAGDTIAFCRGGSIAQDAESFWNNTNCTADNPCIIRDYLPTWDTGSGPDSTAMPIITSSGYTRVFGFWNSGYHQHPQGGYRVQNLSIQGSSQIAVGIGSGTTDTTLCNLVIDGLATGVQDDCKGGTSQRTTVKGSKILNTRGMGVLLGGNGNVIADNFFDNNGREPSKSHSIYLSVHGSATGEVVSGNEIHRNVWDAATNRCRSDSIVAHGWHERLLIDNNLIVNTGISGGSCWGIALTIGAYPEDEGFVYAVVRRNRIYGTGSVGIAVDRCARCVVENNLVVVDGNGSGGVEAIKAPVIGCSREITVRNNTIHFTAGASSGDFIGISSVSGSGHVFANNAISREGTASTDRFQCMTLRSSYAHASHNSCWGVRTKSYPGQEVTVQAEPRYANPGSSPTHDFTLLPGSPLVNAGDPSSAPQVDLNGKARDATPDIGAYER